MPPVPAPAPPVQTIPDYSPRDAGDPVDYFLRASTTSGPGHVCSERDFAGQENETVGRRVGGALRRLSGGALKIGSRLDIDDLHALDRGMDLDDMDGSATHLDDGVYGSVINEEAEMLAAKRRRKVGRTAALVCLGVGMVGAFGVMVWGWSGDIPGRDELGVDVGSGGAEGPLTLLQEENNTEEDPPTLLEPEDAAAETQAQEPELGENAEAGAVGAGGVVAPIHAPTSEPTIDEDASGTSDPTFEPTADELTPEPTLGPTTSTAAAEAYSSPTPAPMAVVSSSRGEGDAPRDETEPKEEFPTLSPPGEELLEACTQSSVGTASGWDACYGLCRAAECCFVTPGDRPLSCLDAHAAECKLYGEVCSVLDVDVGEDSNGTGSGGDGQLGLQHDEPSTAVRNETQDEAAAPAPVLPHPPSDIYDVCSPSSIAAGSFDECRSVCAPSKCCYVRNNEAASTSAQYPSCHAGNEFACASYDEACSILDYYDVTTGLGLVLSIDIPPPPTDLADSCSTSSIAFYEGFVTCHQWCFRAKCCSVDIASCTVTNPDMCKEYVPCDNLPSHQDYGTAASSLPINKDEEEEEEVTTEAEAEAGGQEAGAILGEGHVGSEEESTGGADNGAHAEHNMEEITEGLKEEVQFKCRTDALSTEGGILECTNACSSAMCCFFTPSDNTGVKESGGAQSQMGGTVTASCLNHATSEWCGQYGACELLLHLDEAGAVDGVDDEEAVAAIKKACADVEGPLLIESDSTSTTCANVCSPARCCFTDKIDCSNEVQCDHYKDCSVVYGEPATDRVNTSQSLMPPSPSGKHSEGGEERRRRRRLLRWKR